MLKKICVLLLGAFSVYAGSVVETFDWGPGVPRRERFTAGMPIAGVQAQSGGVLFNDFAKDRCYFSGEAGLGRGTLTLKGANNAVGISCPVSGVTTMSAEGKFFPGEGKLRGFWIGFQSASADNLLLNNQTTDRLSAQFNPTGGIILRCVIGGVTNTAAMSGGRVQFSPGDLIKMKLTVNLDGKTATVEVLGAGSNKTESRTVKWNSDRLPDWNTATVNQTGSGELQLESIEVHTDISTQIVG